MPLVLFVRFLRPRQFAIVSTLAFYIVLSCWKSAFVLQWSISHDPLEFPKGPSCVFKQNLRGLCDIGHFT